MERNIFYSSNGAAVFFTFAVGPHVAKSKVDHNLTTATAWRKPRRRSSSRIFGRKASRRPTCMRTRCLWHLKPGDFRLKPGFAGAEDGDQADRPERRRTYERLSEALAGVARARCFFRFRSLDP